MKSIMNNSKMMMLSLLVVAAVVVNATKHKYNNGLVLQLKGAVLGVSGNIQGEILEQIEGGDRYPYYMVRCTSKCGLVRKWKLSESYVDENLAKLTPPAFSPPMYKINQHVKMMHRSKCHCFQKFSNNHKIQIQHRSSREMLGATVSQQRYTNLGNKYTLNVTVPARPGCPEHNCKLEIDEKTLNHYQTPYALSENFGLSQKPSNAQPKDLKPEGAAWETIAWGHGGHEYMYKSPTTGMLWTLDRIRECFPKGVWIGFPGSSKHQPYYWKSTEDSDDTAHVHYDAHGKKINRIRTNRNIKTSTSKQLENIHVKVPTRERTTNMGERVGQSYNTWSPRKLQAWYQQVATTKTLKENNALIQQLGWNGEHFFSMGKDALKNAKFEDANAVYELIEGVRYGKFKPKRRRLKTPFGIEALEALLEECRAHGYQN